MKIEKLKKFFIEFCVAYTFVTIGIVVIETIIRGELSKDYFNIASAFLWTLIAIITLSLYPLFEKISTLVMIILQYTIAMGLVLLSVKTLSFFEPIHPDGYRDVFISFTNFYIVGSGVFYWHQRRAVKKQNEILNFIKNRNM